MGLKPFLAFLACFSIPVITYLTSIIIVHVQVANKELKRYKLADKKNEFVAIYFTSLYLTFVLFAGFLMMALSKDLIKKNIFTVIILSTVDGALTVTAAGGVFTAQVFSSSLAFRISMFVGGVFFTYANLFPLLPTIFQCVRTGLTFSPPIKSTIKRFLLKVICIGLAVAHAGVAIALTIKIYSTDPDDYESYNYYISNRILALSLPALLYFIMIMAMILYILINLEWGIRSFSILSFFLVGYTLIYIIDYVYSADIFGTIKGEDVSLRRANIPLLTASTIIVLIKIFFNTCWPILYNVQRKGEADDEAEITAEDRRNVRS